MSMLSLPTKSNTRSNRNHRYRKPLPFDVLNRHFTEDRLTGFPQRQVLAYTRRMAGNGDDLKVLSQFVLNKILSSKTAQPGKAQAGQSELAHRKHNTGNLWFTKGQVRSECLTYTFRASCSSALLSRVQVPALFTETNVFV